MSIACLRIPHFALRIALLDRPHLDGAPLILSNAKSNRVVVLDATPEAQEKGVRPGMTLREATSLCPAVVVLDEDPVRATTQSQEIGTRLDDVSPLIEPDPGEQGCWYIDLAGMERSYGTIEQAILPILACVSPMLRSRVGVSSGKFTSRVAAGVARPGSWHIVPDGDEAEFLEPASIRWLPFPPEILRQLEHLGIMTLGAFADQPGHKVAARFGPDGRWAWDLASGRDDRPVVPRPHVPVVVEHLVMPVPAVSREMLMIGLRQMVNRAFSHPDLRNRYARQINLRAVLEGERRSWERSLTLKEPCGADRVIAALEMRLQHLEMPGPIEEISLELSGIAGETARQMAFARMGPRATAPLTHAIRQLKHRYGSSPLYRIAEVEPWSRIPERRHALISYDP